MTQQKTSPLFQTESKRTLKSEWGTFKDSLRAPVHRWFTYPAGFSYKAVQNSFEFHDIKPGMTVYDPFMGSGTTNLTAKCLGISSIGVEAHPFIFEILKAKMQWDVNKSKIVEFLSDLSCNYEKDYSKIANDPKIVTKEIFPELLSKCYSDDILIKLFVIRTRFEAMNGSAADKRFVKVAITALLRMVSAAATGWPYIAPNKVKSSSLSKDPLVELEKLLFSMLGDLSAIKRIAIIDYQKSSHQLIKGSSADIHKHVKDESVDHIFTSPPYLNNFDYSDRTRLELYYWGLANTWGEISKKYRTKLMTSATTQVNRSHNKYQVSDLLLNKCPISAAVISEAVQSLEQIRHEKGGKKSYDLMVAGYFNDMCEILSECVRVTKPGSKSLFVLGDSAPYGIHVPTDVLIGMMGVELGYDDYDIEVLRTRGDKWKANPQRHNVPLRESVVVLNKK